MAKGKRIEDLKKKMTDGSKEKRAMLQAAGTILVSRTQRAFNQQKRGRFEWSARQIPNVAGLLRDFEQGAKAPKPRRFEARPALVDSGFLKGSISFRVVNNKAVEYGSTAPYASNQNRGLESSITITDKAKAGIRQWLNSRQGAEWVRDLSFLTRPDAQELRITPAARPFIMITEDDKKAISLMLRDRIKK